MPLWRRIWVLGGPDRAKKALIGAISTSLAVGVILSYFSFFHGGLLAQLFARDATVIAAAAEYLKAYAVDCLLVSFLFCIMGYFNGCGRTAFVMIQGIAGAFLVRIPVSWMMSRVQPVSLFGVGVGNAGFYCCAAFTVCRLFCMDASSGKKDAGSAVCGRITPFEKKCPDESSGHFFYLIALRLRYPQPVWGWMIPF